MAEVSSWTPVRSDTFMAVMAQAISRKGDGYYVISGCDVTEHTANNMTVDVNTGYVSYANQQLTVPATLSISCPSDPSQPRFYVIYVDSTGTPNAYQGTALAISPSSETVFRKMEQPYPGDSTPTGVPLSIVYVAAGATTITNAVILDIAQHGQLVIPRVNVRSVQSTVGVGQINIAATETVVAHVAQELSTGFIIYGSLIIMEV